MYVYIFNMGLVEGELEQLQSTGMINFRVIHSMVVQPTYSINMQRGARFSTKDTR